MWKAEYMCCLWVQRMYVSIRKCLLNEQEVSSLQEKQQNINGRSENRLQTHTAQNSFNHVVYDCELDVGSHGSISPLSDKKGNYIKLDAAVRLESLDISFPYADTDWGGSWGGSPHSFFFFLLSSGWFFWPVLCKLGLGCGVGKCILGSSASWHDRQQLMLTAEAVMGKVHIYILIMSWTPTLSL